MLKQKLMAASGTTHSTTVTRSRWREILATVVAAEFEPAYRRNHRRYPVHGEVKVVGQLNGQPFRRTMPLLEASAEGLTAKSETELPDDFRVEMTVHVTEEPLLMRGKIVHCTQTLGGHKVGIHIEFTE